MLAPDPALLLSSLCSRCASGCVAAAVVDRVAELAAENLCKIKDVAVLRFQGGEAAPAHLISARHLTDTTARLRAPHPRQPDALR
jgi:hypothetical protein